MIPEILHLFSPNLVIKLSSFLRPIRAVNLSTNTRYVICCSGWQTMPKTPQFLSRWWNMSNRNGVRKNVLAGTLFNFTKRSYQFRFCHNSRQLWRFHQNKLSNQFSSQMLMMHDRHMLMWAKNTSNEQFLLFPTAFSILLETFLPFSSWSKSEWSSANSFSLEKPRFYHLVKSLLFAIWQSFRLVQSEKHL